MKCAGVYGHTWSCKASVYQKRCALANAEQTGFICRSMAQIVGWKSYRAGYADRQQSLPRNAGFENRWPYSNMRQAATAATIVPSQGRNISLIC